MRLRILSALLVCALASLGSAQCTDIDLGVPGGNGQSGNMFDLHDTTGAGHVIEEFLLHLDAGTWDIEVYTVTAGGSYVGNDTNPLAWTLVGSATGVVSSGLNAYTPTGIGGIALQAAPQGFYVTCANGTGINYTNNPTAGVPLVINDGVVQYTSGTGNVYPFAGSFADRLFNGLIRYSAPGAPVEWQVNSAGASLDFDGKFASSTCGGGVSTHEVFVAPAVPTFASSTLTFSTNNGGMPGDIAITNTLPVSASGGALPLGPELVNVNLAALVGFVFDSPITPNVGVPLPNVPGTSGLSLTFSLSNLGPGDLGLVGFTVNPAAPVGFDISQGAGLSVVGITPPTVVAGPTGDDTTTTVDIVSNLWTAGGVTFYGTPYTELHVAANGRVTFGLADGDWAALPATAMTDQPSVGCWTDLSPNQGGSVTISTPAQGSGIINIDYVNIPYFGPTVQTSTFGIMFDANLGTVDIYGLTGVAAGAPATFLGMSPGNAVAATDPGAVDFALTGLGGAGTPTDMLYDFDNVLGQVATVTTMVNGGALGTISFAPDGAGNYTYTTF